MLFERSGELAKQREELLQLEEEQRQYEANHPPPKAAPPKPPTPPAPETPKRLSYQQQKRLQQERLQQQEKDEEAELARLESRWREEAASKRQATHEQILNRRTQVDQQIRKNVSQNWQERFQSLQDADDTDWLATIKPEKLLKATAAPVAQPRPPSTPQNKAPQRPVPKTPPTESVEELEDRVQRLMQGSAYGNPTTSPRMHSDQGPNPPLRTPRSVNSSAVKLPAINKGSVVSPSPHKRNWFVPAIGGVALSDEEIAEQFNKLDRFGNGWITKADARIALADAFPTAVPDGSPGILERLLASFNRMGPERLTRDEFAIVLLRLAQ
eukprot:TRINITY_DN14169_c0_g1_i1.p1 TRINITY_DN14169_c0_g1~~TRINITY_DN14169_c0_g1_i1.p1  ORF type:complete len:334 (+),score=53.31 TRINITY_DN14169_c0_g1_i1:24-1004(+)